MKKIKLLSILSLLLCAVIVLSSCVFSNNLANFLNKDPLPSDAPLISDISEIPELYGYTGVSQSGPLFHFTYTTIENGVSYTEHKVYNADIDEIVYSITKRTYLTSVVVNFGQVVNGASTLSDYFSVHITEQDAASNVEYLTELYDDKGAKIISENRSLSVQKALDLFGLDGKLFRFNEDGKVELALELSPLSKIPSVSHKVGKYYYSIETATRIKKVVVYDNDLNYVSDYVFPDYANYVFATILENGKIFAQYTTPENDEAEDFDFTLSTASTTTPKKYSLKTFIINPKNGKVKNVNCDYVIANATCLYDNTSSIGTPLAWNLEGLGVIGNANKIIDGKFTTSSMYVAINNFGKVSEMPKLNSSIINNIRRVNNDLWIITTVGNDTNIYLVDRKGNIISDISYGVVYNTMIVSNKTIYDLELNPIYDLSENEMTVYKSVGNSLLLKDDNSGYYLYDGTNEPVLLNNSDNIFFEKVIYDLVIFKRPDATTGDYVIYNESGTQIGTINDVSTIDIGAFNTGNYDNVILISVSDANSQVVPYRATRDS